MREIKLQLVWQGAIYEPLTIQELACGQWEIEGKMYEDNENNGNKKGDYVSIPRKDYLFFSQDENDFGIWRQFTGLLDKNGKEIYEGDIVKCSIGTKAKPLFVNKEIAYFEEYGIYGMKGQISWRLTNNSIPFGKSGSSTSYTPYLLSEFWRRNIEIIGNIYENQELIK